MSPSYLNRPTEIMIVIIIIIIIIIIHDQTYTVTNIIISQIMIIILDQTYTVTNTFVSESTQIGICTNKQRYMHSLTYTHIRNSNIHKCTHHCCQEKNGYVRNFSNIFAFLFLHIIIQQIKTNRLVYI